jgi:phage N-6-adenine-methyltransferase
VTQLQLMPCVAEGERPSASSDEWYTPRHLFRQFEEDLGVRFTLDVCATRESAKCPRFFDLAGDSSLAVDGLAQDWSAEVVWCNPPYSAANLPRWIRKCSEQWGRALFICALLPAWTDRPWWQQHIEPHRRRGSLEVRFLPGRISFGWPGRPEGTWGTGMFPSVLVLWRCEAFSSTVQHLQQPRLGDGAPRGEAEHPPPEAGPPCHHGE